MVKITVINENGEILMCSDHPTRAIANIELPRVVRATVAPATIIIDIEAGSPTEA